MAQALVLQPLFFKQYFGFKGAMVRVHSFPLNRLSQGSPGTSLLDVRP